MAITAADVKKLRDMTGAGMMDSKKALTEADGDFDRAVELLRIKGQAKAAKRDAERTTSNGLIAVAENAMIELACETDYVAKNQQFQDVAGEIVAAFAKSDATDVDAAVAISLGNGRTAGEAVIDLAAIIGEKLELRRAVKLQLTPGQSVASYLHRKAADLPPQVGVLVAFTGSDVAAARGAAMQVAALKAPYLTRDDVPAGVVDAEKRVAEEKARAEGKPDAALARIVDSSVNTYFKNNVLLEQASVQDGKKTVKALLDEAGVTLTGFAHLEVGQV